MKPHPESEKALDKAWLALNLSLQYYYVSESSRGPHVYLVRVGEPMSTCPTLILAAGRDEGDAWEYACIDYSDRIILGWGFPEDECAAVGFHIDDDMYVLEEHVHIQKSTDGQRALFYWKRGQNGS